MAVPVAVVSLLCTLTYRVGRDLPPELRMMDPRRRPTIDEAFAARPIAYALQSNEPNDVVFFGDSTCRNGIDPKRLNGFSSCNIGSARGLGPKGMAVTIFAYLTHHPRPKAVVMCVSPFCFEVDTGTAGGEFPVRFVANYGPEVPGVLPAIESVSYFIRRGAVSSLDGNAREVRDDPLDGYERETYRTFANKMAVSRGFFALPRVHGQDRPIDRPGPQNIVNADWDQWIRRVADKCRADGVPLLIHFTPISRDVADAREWSQLERWTTEIEASEPGVYVARPIVVSYEPAEMWDNIHLNAVGVDRFVPMIARDVQAVLGK
jgi:hypothetical protein